MQKIMTEFSFSDISGEFDGFDDVSEIRSEKALPMTPSQQATGNLHKHVHHHCFMFFCYSTQSPRKTFWREHVHYHAISVLAPLFIEGTKSLYCILNRIFCFIRGAKCSPWLIGTNVLGIPLILSVCARAAQCCQDCQRQYVFCNHAWRTGLSFVLSAVLYGWK